MKKLVLVFSLLPALVFAQPVPITEQSKLLWQDVVGLAQALALPEEPSTPLIVGQVAGGVTSIIGGVSTGNIGHPVQAGPVARRVGTAISVTGTISLLTGIGNMINSETKKSLVKNSDLFRRIEVKIGTTKADELLADLRARTGLLRLLREYCDVEQSAAFFAHFRAEREKLARLIPENSMERDQRNLVLDIGGARRAAIAMVIETSTEAQKVALRKELEDDLKRVAETMKTVPQGGVPHAGAEKPMTH